MADDRKPVSLMGVSYSDGSDCIPMSILEDLKAFLLEMNLK